MPLFFAVDPEAITDSSPELSQIVEMHRRVLLEWRDIGLLVHPGAKLHDSPLVSVIDRLPSAVKHLWLTALKHNKRRPCSVDWDGEFKDETCATLSQEWRIALLDSAKATLIADLEDHQLSKTMQSLNGMEICRFHGFSQSESATQVRRAFTTSLSAGSSCQSEWTRRYKSWIRACDSAALVDRYALKDHIHCEKVGKRSGLWLALQEFNLRSKYAPTSIEIMVGDEDVTYNNIEDFADQILTNLRGGGIKTIRLTVAPDAVFRDNCHHRYMRCDYAIFGFDKGFSAFSGENVSRDSVVWKKDRLMDEIFDKSERAISQGSSHTKIIF